jgi:acylphosphatase
MLKRAEVRFTGKVQGVYFRDFTKRYSEELGVVGWVMNLDDDSVKAVFEGEENDILEVIRRLWEEHPIAKVDNAEVLWGEHSGGYRDFRIEYLD